MAKCRITRKSRNNICSFKKSPQKVSRLLPALSHQLISISVSSAHLSISGVLFLTSAYTVSI